tara:strand:- start:310 stop:660 length:351 start_codon:yes stop_codon:yes gene_type:complete
MSLTVDKISRTIKKLEGNSQFVVRSTENEENTTWDSVTIEFVNGNQEFTQSQIQTEMDRLQAEHDAQDYARARDISYPNLKEFAEAYTEKEIGGDDTKWNAYVTKYNKVRTDNPKG